MSMDMPAQSSHTTGMKFRIREMRRAAGMTQEQMAERLDISPGLYNGLENGKRRMNETYLEGIADIFGVRPTELIVEDRPTVSIAGKVGAGARVPVIDAYAKGDGPQVEAPPQIPSTGIVAVEIEGDSMEPVYSAGDFLFYSRDTHEGVPIEAIGKRCVCEDIDGNGWVKVVREGREYGLFDLHSFNDTTPPMYGVTLKWAAPVRLHWPAEFAKKR